jgi:hypothetical protein
MMTALYIALGLALGLCLFYFFDTVVVAAYWVLHVLSGWLSSLFSI